MKTWIILELIWFSGTGGVHFFDFLELLSHHIQHEPNDEEDMLDCLRGKTYFILLYLIAIKYGNM